MAIQIVSSQFGHWAAPSKQVVLTSNQTPALVESGRLIEIERVTKDALDQTRKSYEVYIDSLLDINPSLWISSHLYSPKEILNLLFADFSQLPTLYALFELEIEEGIRELNIQFLFSYLEEINRKIVHKARRVTHEEILYFYYLNAYLAKIPESEKVRNLISKEIYKNGIQSLSVEEKGKLARYANLIDVPTEESAQAFRQEILPYLYTIGRPGRIVQNSWWSVSQILKRLIFRINEDLGNLTNFRLQLQDPYFFQIDNEKLEVNLKNLVLHCEELLKRLQNGEEVQLPKFYHGIKSAFKNRLTLPELFLFQDIQEVNSEEAKYVGTFIATYLALKYGPPSLALPDSAAWRKEKHIYNSFRPENPDHLSNDKLEYWFSFKRSVPYCQYDFANKIAGYNLCSVIVDDCSVMDQRKLFSKYKIQPSIMGLTAAKLFEHYLANYPLLLPNHLAKQKITLNPKFKSSVDSAITKQIVNGKVEDSAPKKIKLDSQLSQNENSSVIIDSYQKALIVGEKLPLTNLETTISEYLQSGIVYAQLAFDKGMTYAQMDSARLPSPGFKLSNFFVYALTHSKTAQEAILKGILTQKNPLIIKSSIKQQCHLNKLYFNRSERFAKAKHLFDLCDKDLPPPLRHTWPHFPANTIPDGSVVGHQPLLAFNFANVQTLLLHESLFLRDLLMRDINEKFKQWLGLADNQKHFFGLLAYQLINQARESNQILFYHLNTHSIEVAIDYNTFDKGKESGRNFRCYPNEPFLTYKLLKMLSEESLCLLLKRFSFQFSNQTKKFLQPKIKGLTDRCNGSSSCHLSKERVLYVYDLLLEIGTGIYQRYFTPLDTKRQLPSNLSNAPLLDVLQGFSKKDILKNNNYSSLLIN